MQRRTTGRPRPPPVGRRRRGFQAYLDLFHWTELIQSSPIAVERSVYEVIGGAYRKNNVTGLELRFNPMKRNRGGEQDLDHIIAAAVRGMDRAILEYPQVRAGLIFCLDRSSAGLTRSGRQGESHAQPRRDRHRHRPAGTECFRFATTRASSASAAAPFGLPSPPWTGGAAEVLAGVRRSIPTARPWLSQLEAPLARLLRAGTVLEVAKPTSHAGPCSVAECAASSTPCSSRRAVHISTDGPRMLRVPARRFNLLMRHDILSLEQVERAMRAP